MEFKYSNPRARKARLARILLKKPIKASLLISSLLLLALWIYLAIYQGLAIAHLLLTLDSLPGLVYIFTIGELANIKPASKNATNDVADLLEPKLLGFLKEQTSAKELAELMKKVSGGQFFGARFAISFDFIGTMLSDSNIELRTIWQKAQQLSEDIKEVEVSSSSVAAALILTADSSQFYLAQLKLGPEDIVDGLKWSQHIKSVIEKSREKQSHGGIGRDLSFGWAPLLNHIGLNISEEVQMGGLLNREVQGHQEVINQVMHSLSQPGRRNATLVGEVGVGKTTLVYALAQKLLQDKTVPKEIRFRQIIALDSASLIANTRGRGELENLLIRIFNEAAKAKNVILFLDEAQLFLQEGTGSTDLSSILLPVLEGGGIRLILALDSQNWLRLSQNNPGLAQLMNKIIMEPLNQADTQSVLEDQVLLMEVKNKVTYMYQSLKEGYNLADRYVRDQAFPGKAVKLLESAAMFKEQQYFITEKSVQMAIEKSYGVKVQVASDVTERDTLLNLEGKIHERMINQTRAVQVVSDALRRARAGVKNQQKPVGTFLFLGPTGVGKTELAKSLAAIYFGGENQMVRIDLNEYPSADDVRRLIATPNEDPYSLTAQISKQPFSVVLFDEIEKAHPNVLNVLLQLLDEGILRDSTNKPVNFRDSIIIATSNAGADEIRGRIDKGENLESFEDDFVNNLISSNIFKPEFINRFDEIVLFRPLNKPELMQVVDLILAGINKTLAAQKVSVKLTDTAKSALVDAGYDPRLGARPLRRVVQRSIENIVAQKLLAGQTGAGSELVVDAPEIQTALSKRQS